MLHRIWSLLRDGDIGTSGKLGYIAYLSKWLIQWGAAVPSGTPTAYIYINTLTPDTTHTIYINVNGTWTALTIN